MENFFRIIRAVVFVAVFSLSVSCSDSSSEEGSPTQDSPSGEGQAMEVVSEPVTTEEAVATEVPKILIEDDFSNPNSGWERYREFDGILDYENDAYRMFVDVSANIFSVNLDQDLYNTCVEVDAKRVAGPEKNRFGVLCRFDFNYYSAYYFLVGSDGSYGIGKFKQFNLSLLGTGKMETNSAILGGVGLNKIRADCVGDTLTLFVNDEQLLQVRDSEFQHGGVGLLAGSVDEAGVDIYFDNFVVMEP
jgi:hypothetical protein